MTETRPCQGGACKGGAFEGRASRGGASRGAPKPGYAIITHLAIIRWLLLFRFDQNWGVNVQTGSRLLRATRTKQKRGFFSSGGSSGFLDLLGGLELTVVWGYVNTFGILDFI